jgi:hypothetical protein
MKRIFVIFGIIIALCGGGFAQQTPLVSFQIPLSGRLISGLDPSKLIDTSGDSPQISNFATLTNMEYTDAGIRSIRGMSKITTSPLADTPLIHNIFQFVKSNPSETHVLVQARTSDESDSRVYAHSTSTPGTGTFTATSLHTDTTGAGTGRFNDAPIGHAIYCNGGEAPQVWGGNENSPGYVSIFDGTDPATDTTWIIDYTDQVLNDQTDSENIATFKKVTATQVDFAVGDVAVYVNTRLPIEGVKFYVGTANTTSGTTAVNYWNGSTMTAVSGLVDNTASGGIPLAQTGFINFDSTESTAKVRMIEGVYGYWYRFKFPGADATTTISRITVKESFQDLVDFWDGKPRNIFSFQVGTGTAFTDATTNVVKDEYSYDDSTKFDESTYVNLDQKGGGGTVLLMGFDERIMGVEIKIIPDKINASPSVLSVRTWDGVNFNTASDLIDNTGDLGTPLTQSGLVTWTPRNENIEFRRTVGGNKQPLYYYQFVYTANLSANGGTLFVYHINGIPVQKPISNYKFGLNAQGSLWLFNDQSGERNKSIVSNVATLNVFNGEGSGDPLFWGDDEEIQAAITVHSRTTAGSRDNILALKNNSAHLLIGEKIEDRQIVTISNRIGCNAPLTLAASSIGLEFAPLQSKQVAIWQGNGGIYIWDGTSIIPISDTISNYFDQSKPEAINVNRANLSRGFFEVHDSRHYYHWLFSSKATTTTDLDTELVFDLRRQGWFNVSRGTKPLQAGTSVIATDTGVSYAYGAVDTGDLMRLDNGTSWDSEPINSIFETGDIPLSSNIMTESKLRYLRLITKSKATSTNNVVMTHYADTGTGTSFNMSPARAGYRLAMPLVSRNHYGTFHRFRASMTASDEDIGFEPMALGGWVDPSWREVHQ